MSATLQPGTGRIRAAAYLPVDARRRSCGAGCRARPTRRCCASSRAPRSPSTRSATRASSTTRAATRWRTSRATASRRTTCSTDAVEIVGTLTRDPADGPHVVTGPIHVAGAMPGDLLAITVLETTPRVPYGVISNRHGRGALPGELPARPGERERVRHGQGRHHRLPARRRGRRAPDRVPARTRSSGSWASRSPATSARTRCRPARTAATSTSTCCRWAARSTCRCRCRARWRTWATRTSRRATARWRSPRWRRRCGSRSGSTWCPAVDALAQFGPFEGPLVETPDYLVPTGLDKDLDEAVRKCVRAAIAPAAGAVGSRRAPRVRVPVRGHRHRHLPGGRPGLRGARPHPGGRPRTARAPDDRSRTPSCRRRFDAYERALADDDVAALDDSFAPGPDDAARRQQRPARRARRDQRVPQRAAAASRPGCWTGSSPAAWPTTAGWSSRPPATRAAAPGCRRRCGSWPTGRWRDHRRARHRPHAQLRPVGVAHGRRPALPGRVRRSPAGPARRGQGRVRRPRATGSAPGNPTWLRDAARERQHAPAVLDLLKAGASVRGIARTDELAYSIAGANPHYGTPANGAVAGGAPGRLVERSGDRGRDRPGGRRAGQRHRRVDPRPGELPGPVGAADDARAGAAAGHAAAGAVVRHRRLADPRRRDARRGRHVVPRGRRPAAPVAPARARRGPAAGRARDPGGVRGLVGAGPSRRSRSVRSTSGSRRSASVQAAEAWRAHGAWVTAHPDAVGPGVRERFAIASEVTADAGGRRPRAEVERLAARIRAVVDDAVLVLPDHARRRPRRRTASAAELDRVRAATLRMTALAGIGGLPALTFPALHLPVARSARHPSASASSAPAAPTSPSSAHARSLGGPA